MMSFHLFHKITLAMTFSTHNPAIVVTPLFWRGAGGEAAQQIAKLIILIPCRGIIYRKLG